MLTYMAGCSGTVFSAAQPPNAKNPNMAMIARVMEFPQTGRSCCIPTVAEW